MQTCSGIRVHNVQRKLHLNALVANKQAMFIHFQQVFRARNCLSATGQWLPKNQTVSVKKVILMDFIQLTSINNIRKKTILR